MPRRAPALTRSGHRPPRRDECAPPCPLSRRRRRWGDSMRRRAVRRPACTRCERRCRLPRRAFARHAVAAFRSPGRSRRRTAAGRSQRHGSPIGRALRGSRVVREGVGPDLRRANLGSPRCRALPYCRAADGARTSRPVRRSLRPQVGRARNRRHLGQPYPRPAFRRNRKRRASGGRECRRPMRRPSWVRR
jgi:hypothetical protein